MENKIKKLKDWEKSGLSFDEYYQTGDRIDEDTYNFLGSTVAPEYCDEHFVQLGEASDTIEGVYFHSTGFNPSIGVFYYLGDLPSFEKMG